MINEALLESLYEMGAEIVYTATGARKASQMFTFEGQSEPLEVSLPPGHYVVCKVAARPGETPGLTSVVNQQGRPKRKPKKPTTKRKTAKKTSRKKK